MSELNPAFDTNLGRQLVADELFDLSLYQELYKIAPPELKGILAELIPIETRHHAFWQDFFKTKVSRLDAGRRIKLQCLVFICRIFKSTGIHLTLEAIEIYGVRKYLSIWDSYRGTPLGQAVEGILEDEFKHEDAIVSQAAARKINPERIRSIFLGFNDGLVELLGAVSGFYAALSNPQTILAAGVTVAAAGAFSMAAGAYAAGSSEREVQKIEEGKERFIQRLPASSAAEEPAWRVSALVGLSYAAGALVPILPLAFGAKSMAFSVATSAAMAILVSVILSFLSGMNVKKRIALNLCIIAAAVAVTFLIGFLAKSLWGIST